MIVSFANILKAYSGKCDGLVYMYNRRLNKVIARRMPAFKPHAGTERLTTIAHNLKALNISEGYRNDLRIYTEMYRMSNPPVYTWYNMFTKLMWALHDATGVDLAQITRTQIEEQELPCNSVKRAVDAGLIPPVQSYERLTSVM